MNTEYEAKFPNIDKDAMRKKLQECGATLIYPEFLQVRAEFDMPHMVGNFGEYVRVRQESDKVTMTYKNHQTDQIDGVQEIELIINDYQSGVDFLKTLGAIQTCHKENYREKWMLNDAEVTLDTYPFLEPYVEVEGSSVKSVIETANKLQLDMDTKLSDTNAALYAQKYSITKEEAIHLPKMVFDMPNPFL